MIVKLAGPGGSGKTTLMRALMKHWTFQANHGKVTDLGEFIREEAGLRDNAKPLFYSATILGKQPLSEYFNSVVVLGSYESVCGGMDTITDNNTRMALVQRFCSAPSTLVLFEGLLTGTTYGALGAMSETSEVPWIYMFLDTPFEVCAERIRNRRKARGETKPYNPEKSLRGHVRSCQSVLRTVREKGHLWQLLDHTCKPEALANVVIQVVKEEAKRAKDAYKRCVEVHPGTSQHLLKKTGRKTKTLDK
jgi:thymidylate kinase